MSLGSVPVLLGRTIYLDGDGLAYYCAGNDDTLIGEARSRLADKVRGMQAACGAERAVILLTSSGSHKGHRYAVARAKVYQGQRANSRRPANWKPLRQMLEDGVFGNEVHSTATAEADDLFGYYGHSDPERTVIATQDKDMRMVPGWHIDWLDNRLKWVPPNTYDLVLGDKQYGMKWFWLQMLHGDTADYIPGLPWLHSDNGKVARCGEVTAGKLLADTTCNADAAAVVAAAYKGCYKHRWLVELLEQAVLLWMRRGPNSEWDDCVQLGGPLFGMFYEGTPESADAYSEVLDRIKTVEAYALAATEDN
jgi:hypothetical protein